MECSSGACRTTCVIVIVEICGPERPKIKLEAPLMWMMLMHVNQTDDDDDEYFYIKTLLIVSPIVGFCNCSMFCCVLLCFHSSFAIILIGVQWLSSRVLDSRPRGCGLEPHQRHCVVVLEQDTFILY